MAAAKAKADHLKSETIRTSVTVFGDPTIRAGAPFRYVGVRPELDAIEFIVETATHRLSKAGYTTDIEAKLKPQQSAAGSKGSGGSTPDTSPPSSSGPAAPTVPSPTPPSIPGGIGHA